MDDAPSARRDGVFGIVCKGICSGFGVLLEGEAEVAAEVEVAVLGFGQGPVVGVAPLVPAHHVHQDFAGKLRSLGFPAFEGGLEEVEFEVFGDLAALVGVVDVGVVEGVDAVAPRSDAEE